jgi:hypothetical protein
MRLGERLEAQRCSYQNRFFRMTTELYLHRVPKNLEYIFYIYHALSDFKILKMHLIVLAFTHNTIPLYQELSLMPLHQRWIAK